MKTTESEYRLYIANLGKYNEGELVGDWIDLPFTQDELSSLFVDIGLGEYDLEGIYSHGKEVDGNYYEEWAIHDYELPFSIGEYANIYKLNEMFEWINDNDIELVDLYNNYDYESILGTLKNLAYEISNHFSNNVEEIIQDYYTIDEIDELFLQSEAEQGFARLYHFMGNVTPNDEVVRINGYGNLSPVTKDDLEALQKDLLDTLKSEFMG